MTPPDPDEGTGRRAGLDHDDVVDCALALVEAGGPEALTMRKLAAELGVTTTTVYWHVGGRDDIVAAVVERVAQREAATEIEGTTPRQRVLSAARRVWTSALAHPEVTSLAHQAGASPLLGFPHEVALAAELNAAGLHGAEARDALRGILACVSGFLVLALRSADTATAGHSSRDLWAAVDTAEVDDATRRALSEPVDLPALFERTLSAVVESAVPARPRRPGAASARHHGASDDDPNHTTRSTTRS